MTTFIYNCNTADDSAHAWMRDRSPCPVTVLGLTDCDPPPEAQVYEVRFEDGVIGHAWSDEIIKGETL